MGEDFDINKIAAEIVERNIERFLAVGKGMFKGATDQIRLRLSNSFREYVTCVLERYSKAKSFYFRREPIFLYDFYVPVGISVGRKRIEKATAKSISKLNRFMVITAGAGSGKSMLMRHLFLSAAREQERVPVLIELRGIDDEGTLIDCINRALATNKFGLGEEYVGKALRAGRFALFFDGFDETAQSMRNSISKQIRELSELYDQTQIVVSSRPDREFSAWQNFSVCEVDDLTLEQAANLVEKLPVEAETKSKFLADLRDRLFEEHASFLCNPLLLSIMVMTYVENADIPDKLSLFYRQAYDTLFHQHDALKGGFKRDRACRLDIQDFGKVFASFSLQTYLKEAFQFTRSDALEHLQMSKKLTRLEFDIEGYLEDSLQAVSLLIEDGITIRFTHRSFQEFFTARFINGAEPKVQDRLIKRCQVRMAEDSVMDLLYEINPRLVERAYVLPSIDKIRQTIGVDDRVDLTSYLNYLKLCYSSFDWYYPEYEGEEEGISATLTNSEEALEARNLEDFVNKHFEGLVTRRHSVDYPSPTLVKESLQRWGGPWGVQVQGLTPKHPFVELLASTGGWYSISLLEELLEIRQALLDREKKADASLEEVLGISATDPDEQPRNLTQASSTTPSARHGDA